MADSDFEFHISDDPALAGAAIRQHGMAMIRGGATGLLPLKPNFDAALARSMAGDPLPEYGFYAPAQAGGVHMLGQPEDVGSRVPALFAIARAYFETDAVYFDHRLTFIRRVPAGATRIHGMHQDGMEVSHQKMLTMWCSLTPCGEDAPGLEIIRVPGLPWEKLQPGEHWYEGEGDRKRLRAVREFGEDKFWRPVMNSGDVVIFTDAIYHQTYVTPEMTGARVSIDIRVVVTDDNAGAWIR